jgi:hypothetical protein
MSALENPFGNGDQSFTDGVAPTSTEHALSEKRNTFLPWHKPRKQWVRQHQWAKTIDDLAVKLKLQELNEPLRYLSLPGPDLLDVRTIRPLCAAREIELQFVGLNAGDDDKDKALSRALINEVRSMPGIHRASEVVIDKFEHLGKNASTAHARIIGMQRSFDVVNIDLCGSFAESLPNGGVSIPTALLLLLQHQARSRTRDWLFFITTRSDRNAVNQGVMQLFIDQLNISIAADPSLKQKIIDGNLINESEFNGNSIALGGLSPASHSNAFAISIGHWILEGLSNEIPAWRADMLRQYEYHVVMSDAACDMVSLGFYCKRVPAPPQPDVYGIAKVPLANQTPLEEIVQNCREKIYRLVNSRIDLDVRLHEDVEEYAQALESAAKLMAGAQYDEDAYRDFAEKERQKIGEFLSKMGLV